MFYEIKDLFLICVIYFRGKFYINKNVELLNTNMYSLICGYWSFYLATCFEKNEMINWKRSEL